MKKLRQVFSIVPDCHLSGGHYRSLWRRHFYDGLRQVVESLVVPQAIDFDWARQWKTGDPTTNIAARDAASEKLWEQIQTARRAHGIDAVISYCFGHDVNPELVRRVIQSGIPWINFFCDSTHVFEKVEVLARVVSLNWFPEHAAMPAYRALGVPHVCLPYALNPDHLPQSECTVAARESAFIGVPTTNRITQLGLLRLKGCRVDIRGHGWIGAGADPFHSPVSRAERFFKALFQPGLVEKGLRRLVWPIVKRQAGGPLGDEELAAYLSATQVVLGLNQGKDAHGRFMSYLKFRDLEFPGYGCCYLTEHNDDVAAALEVGREVLTYGNLGEAAECLHRVHRDPGALVKIGLAGRRRVQACHTWAVRIAELEAAL